MAGGAAFRGKLGIMLRELNIDSEDWRYWRTGMILLASWEIGPDEAVIAERLGYPLEEVQTVGRRLRMGGIWGEKQVFLDCSHEDDNATLLTTIHLHILVGCGEVARLKD